MPPVRPIVMSIAGSDPTAGAGIQADLKTLEASGCYAVTVLTAITVQDTTGLRRVEPLAPQLVREQLETLRADLPPVAFKSGLLAGAAIVREVIAALRDRGDRPWVCDPVLRAGGNDGDLIDDAGVEAMRELLPHVTLLTPNRQEAARLSGLPVETPEDASRAARALVEAGAAAVLVTGGHLAGSRVCDRLVTRDGDRSFENPRIDVPDRHGTGCVLASAITARLAHGDNLEQAIAAGIAFARNALAGGLAIGGGNGVVDPASGPASRRLTERSR